MPRASDVLGRRVVVAGRDVGRVVDLVTEDGVIVAAVAVRGPCGRLLGYGREQVRGPWLIETFARWVLRREMTTLDWEDVRGQLAQVGREA
jgi:hypothetical protein